jgi:hypothetical protein
VVKARALGPGRASLVAPGDAPGTERSGNQGASYSAALSPTHERAAKSFNTQPGSPVRKAVDEDRP